MIRDVPWHEVEDEALDQNEQENRHLIPPCSREEQQKAMDKMDLFSLSLTRIQRSQSQTTK